MNILRIVMALTLLWVSASAKAADVLECVLGKKVYLSGFATPAALRTEAARLALQEPDIAKAQRAQLSAQAVEAAVAFAAADQTSAANAYWGLLDRELVDTRWRMQQQGKGGDTRALWLMLEWGNRGKSGALWTAADCAALLAQSTLASPGASFRKAQCLQNQDPDAALQWMRAAGVAGHPMAAEVIGRLCAAEGPKGRTCAVRMLCAAADAGRSAVAGLAGYVITSEQPAPGLAVRAAALFEMAINSGDIAAANNLGELYERGWIGRANLLQAEQAYRLAAVAGFPEAQLNLARLLCAPGASPGRAAEGLTWVDRAALKAPEAATQLRKQILHTP